MTVENHDETMPGKRPRWHRLVAGWVLFVPGLIVIPTPLPFGLMMTLLGLSLLASESEWVRHRFRRVRLRYPQINRHLDAIHPRSPKIIQNLLEHTHPRYLQRRSLVQSDGQ